MSKSFYVQFFFNFALVAAFCVAKDRFGAMGYVYLQLCFFSLLILAALPLFLKRWLPEFAYGRTLPGFFGPGVASGLAALAIDFIGRWAHFGAVASTAAACASLAVMAGLYFLLTPQRLEIAQEMQALWPFKGRLRGAR